MQLKHFTAPLLALFAIGTGCDGFKVRPGTFFAHDDGRDLVAFDDRLPKTFNAAVDTCMLTEDQPFVRLEPGDHPALFDQCTPDTRADLATFVDEDAERFRRVMAAGNLRGAERSTVALTTAPLVAEAQAHPAEPLPDLGFSDRVTRRLKVAHQQIFGQDVGHWFCDVGYQLEVELTGLNLSDLRLGWRPAAQADARTNLFEITVGFTDNQDLIMGRGRAGLSQCGFQITNRWLATFLDPTLSVPVPLSAEVRFSIDVEHIEVVGIGRPRVIDGMAELTWTVEANVEGVEVHDTLLPYVSTLDTLLQWLPHVGVDAVGLAEEMVADEMHTLFADQLGPQFELLLNTATNTESGLLMPVTRGATTGPAFRYWR
ncbi:MAG: hypothetical protein ACE366_11935 [Bradymonadia bacterium]